MYALKLVRWMCVWVSAYYARVIFFERFVRQTVVARKRPPSLLGMLWVFLAIQLAAEAVLLVVLTLARGMLSTTLLDRDFRTRYLVDVGASLTVLTVLLAVVGSAISDNRRFDYANEGTRAIRVLEELTVTIAGVTFLIPYFLVLLP
jgi:hypothetical protein